MRLAITSPSKYLVILTLGTQDLPNSINDKDIVHPIYTTLRNCMPTSYLGTEAQQRLKYCCHNASTPEVLVD